METGGRDGRASSLAGQNLPQPDQKAILRQGQVTLRSKTTELVRQEFWGLLLAYYLVRKMMVQAASQTGKDPDLLSYQKSVEIITSDQTGAVRWTP